VPHASASIIASPNGSGHSIGNSRHSASPRNFHFSSSAISPTYWMNVPSMSGRTTRVKYSWSYLSVFAAMRSGIPTACATAMAASGPFSGDMRPRNAR
jgi:hypothetical protein